MNIKILTYTLKKINAFLLEKRELKKYKITNNLYFKGRLDNKKIKKVLIYLNDSYYAHLGDQLFFEPLLKTLKNSYDVVISPTRPMEEYFKNLNYNVKREIDFKNYDLIITRTDFYPLLKNIENTIFLKTRDLNKKICKLFIDEVLNFLNCKIDCVNIKNKPSILKEEENNKLILEEGFKYIIFSNYIDSGSIFTFNKSYKELEKFCKKRANQLGYKVIHVGSKKDKENDRNIYPFVDLDLRGETSVLDLFKIINKKNIVEYIGFDGFIMHLFFIYEKKVFVKVRNKLTKKRMEDIIKYVNPPFENDNQDITYI